jgi:hypothetical protein
MMKLHSEQHHGDFKQFREQMAQQQREQQLATACTRN